LCESEEIALGQREGMMVLVGDFEHEHEHEHEQEQEQEQEQEDKGKGGEIGSGHGPK